MENRAYSLLSVKAIDDDKRVIEGIASTPSPDRMGDIVNPKGAKFKLPIPFLWQHNHDQPIGHVVAAKVTKEGIWFRAEIAKTDEPGKLKDLLDFAWQSIKLKLVAAVSIGFRPLKYAYISDGGIEFDEWEWFELSAVTIPAQAEATIDAVKSIDAALRKAAGIVDQQFERTRKAASGIRIIRSNITPPASGIDLNKTRPKEGQKAMKNIGQKIEELENQRKSIASQLETIQQKAMDENRSKDADEREKFNELRDEMKALDAEIEDLKDIEAIHAPTAKTVENKTDDNVNRRRTTFAEAKAKVDPGIRFAQLVKVRAVSRLDIEPMERVAEKMYGRDSEITAIIKAGEQVPGSTTSGNWAADLVSAEGAAAADFAEYLRPATILGKFGQANIPSLRSVPFRRPLIKQTGGATGYWVGEGKPKPVTQANFDRSTLDPLKCATIIVLTEENIRDSSPSSDMIVRDDIRNALVALEDEAFIDPTNAGSNGVKPAGILYGADSIAAESYSDETDVKLDIRSLLQKYIDANNPAGQAVLIMQEGTALGLSLIDNALGQSAFPGLSMNGGTLLGIPVITSEHVPAGIVAIVNASDVLRADDGQVMIDMSREASLEMKDQANITQNGLAGTGASLVSLWQNNLVGLRAEHVINWKPRRNVIGAYLTGVAWGGAVNPS